MTISAHLTETLQRIEAIRQRLGSGSASPTCETSTQPFAHTLASTATTPQPATAYDAQIQQAASAQQLPPALLRAVIQQESGYNPRAVSSAGAMGLMQLMPATARALGVADPFDPTQNINGGARYLRQLLDRFGGDERLALAAYNAGPGAVNRYGGVPPFAETQRYVARVLELAHAEE